LRLTGYSTTTSHGGNIFMGHVYYLLSLHQLKTVGKPKNISHTNREISILTIKKNQSKASTSSQDTENSEEGKAKQRTKYQETKTKKKTLKQYEQQCQSYKC
jgi:hypothetical protein